MELINVVFNTDTIVLEFTNPIVDPALRIYVDSLDNRNNLTSNQDVDHSIVYTPSDIVTDNTDPGNLKYTITIDKSVYDCTEIIVTFIYTDPTAATQHFYYDEKELYLTIKKFLIKFCSTCLDNEQKEKILMYYFKKDLFDYAVQYGTFEEVLNYYTDLMRMIGGRNYKNFGVRNNNLQACKACVNGLCRIC